MANAVVLTADSLFSLLHYAELLRNVFWLLVLVKHPQTAEARVVSIQPQKV